MTTPLHKKLKILGQEQLLKLPSPLSAALAVQIEKIDLKLLAQQRALLLSPQNDSQQIPYTPLEKFDLIGNLNDLTLGHQLLRQGKVGALIVAGGQGTRLGFAGPKGLFPISVIKGKTLFQLLAEKCLAASQQAGCPLQMAIMTSPQNDQETRNYFETHRYFGLESDQVSLFCQGQLPLLDEKGNLFLETPDTLAEGPDGNGYALKHFTNSGILEKWERLGIHFVNFLPIDNPLADPWDPELIGYHYRQQCDVVIKCIRRDDPEENLGVLVMQDKDVGVIEYTELPQEKKYAKNHEGNLLYQLANISLFSFSVPFIKKVSTKQLPLHLAHKKAKYLAPDGTTKNSEKPLAWKFETFIFDILANSRATALLYPKEQCFAPLKSKEGPNSPTPVKAALQDNDRHLWKKISGNDPQNIPFELAMEFHYPTEQLLKQWRHCSLPNNGYISPTPEK